MVRTSESLLQRLGSSSDDATWQRFVDLYAPLLHEWLRRYGLQHSDACDLAQEVLLTVVREISSFDYDPQRGSFRGWLRTILVNRLRSYWRARAHRIRPGGTDGDAVLTRLDELADPHSDEAIRWAEVHDSRVTQRILALLKTDFEETTWTAFWRVVVEEQDPAAVAASLGISRNAVYRAKLRVLQRLRQEADGLLD